ncbi:hypothetical protein SH591_11190 [Sphingomonas sp. LY54]|uniref:hypothetical protein n=1 Tax=Sphingomonas sp. LY54 TaxID=3095343 RepID=UPI002D78955D|nr:hypothetical protein [Sphingomonas sp. LY54]WRP27679.1 hypothetical protein SH591_11190 [Sphingomonas sp. LY54]
MRDAAATLDDPARGGWFGFLSHACKSLVDPRLRLPAGLLLVVLTFSNIIILFNVPQEGATPSFAFLAAAFARVGGLLVLAVAILRILAASERHPWRPDGAFFLYAASLIVSFGVAALITGLAGEPDAFSTILLRNVLLTAFLAPLAPWVVGIAAATPLGWNPARFLRGFGRWLPPLLAWTLLLVTPMGILHAVIDLHLVKGAGEWFWPLSLFDGALSAVMALLGLGLNVEAYRRVARGR